MSRDAELVAEAIHQVVCILHDTLEYCRVRDREVENRWLRWREEDIAHRNAQDRIRVARNELDLKLLKEQLNADAAL